MDYKSVIAENIAKVTELDREQICKLIEIPPQKDLGDFAFPCFILAKSLHKAPAMISADLAGNEVLTENGMFEVKNAGPYLNFYIDRSKYAADTISRINEAGDKFGASADGNGKNVIIEFSSPNIAKPFHVGHAFTTILGNSLSRIYDRLGYNVIRMNTGCGETRRLLMRTLSQNFYVSMLSSTRKPRQTIPLMTRQERTSKSSRTAAPKKLSSGRSSEICPSLYSISFTTEWVSHSITITASPSTATGSLL